MRKTGKAGRKHTAISVKTKTAAAEANVLDAKHRFSGFRRVKQKLKTL